MATALKQVKELLAALDEHREIRYLFTKANSDTDGRSINRLLEEYAKRNDNFCIVDSLGMRRYLSALIGNSSSGLVEAPSFQIPTIDIGDRQRGRISGETVIHCKPERHAIGDAIHKAMDDSFRMTIKKLENPYGDGHTSEKILEIVKGFFVNDRIDIKKKFYDINFEV